MKRLITVLLVFFAASCSMLIPIESFTIKFVELRDLKHNKVREAPTNTSFKDLDGDFKELIFTTKLNFAKLILNGYVGGGDYKHINALDSCIVFDESIPIKGKHYSLRDLKLTSSENRSKYLAKLENIETYTYSCVLDASRIKDTKISFHAELAYFVMHKKYISNAIEVDLTIHK